MALRLIEMILPETDSQKVTELLKEEHKVIENRQIKLTDGEMLVRILLDAEKSEEVLDILVKHNIAGNSIRLVVLPVDATLPRAVSKPTDASEDTSVVEESSGRVSREELYEGIKSAAKCSHFYLLMVLLSTIVAIVGLYNNSVTIIIGAMLIAPLLKPNMALALGVTLGDLPLLKHAFLTSLIGIVIATLLSMGVGFLAYLDPTLIEVSSRTYVGLGDIVLALASGCAGALAFMVGGVSITLVGVMVAVALLPSLAVFGLLLGGGQLALAMSALLLFLTNLICVILSSVITFLTHGIHPIKWRERNLAAKASHIAILSGVVLLTLLIGLILLRKSQM